MRRMIGIAVRLVALSLLYFICFAAVAGALLSSSSELSPSTEAASSVAPLLIVSFLNTAVLSYLILRSRWARWKLIFAIFFLYYAVTTLMSQIETAFFVTRLPPGMLPRLFLSGAIFGALFSPAAVLVLGKGRANAPESNGRSRLDMTLAEWVGRLSFIAIAYVIIYFTFGYFIAWKSPALRAYYGGSDPGSFLGQMSSVIRETPLLLPLQVFRGILWAIIAVPVIRMMKGPWWEAGLAVSLLFAVLMGSHLLLPNSLMPKEVRLVHLLEVATSNFLFGWLIVLILVGRWRPAKNPAHFQQFP